MAGARGYRRKFDDLKLVVMSETLVDQETAMKHRKILSETTQMINGEQHTIVKYKQVLQSGIQPGSSKRNWNGRGYYINSLIKALDRNPIIQHELKAGPNGTSVWLAEYGHPYEPNPEAAMTRQNIIDPKFICNKINNYRAEGDLLVGECETLAESWGKVLTARILTNLPAMASLRSIGRTGSDGIVLDEGFWIVTFDTVVRPSHKEAMQASKATIVPGHTMNECIMPITVDSDMAKQFILSESSRNLEMISSLGKFDVNTIEIKGNDITMKRVSDNGLVLETIFIPIKVLTGSEYHNIF